MPEGIRDTNLASFMSTFEVSCTYNDHCRSNIVTVRQYQRLRVDKFNLLYLHPERFTHRALLGHKSWRPWLILVLTDHGGWQGSKVWKNSRSGNPAEDLLLFQRLSWEESETFWPQLLKQLRIQFIDPPSRWVAVFI